MPENNERTPETLQLHAFVRRKQVQGHNGNRLGPITANLPLGTRHPEQDASRYLVVFVGRSSISSISTKVQLLSTCIDFQFHLQIRSSNGGRAKWAELRQRGGETTNQNHFYLFIYFYFFSGAFQSRFPPGHISITSNVTRRRLPHVPGVLLAELVWQEEPEHDVPEDSQNWATLQRQYHSS